MPLRIDALTTELRKDPIGIDESMPRLGWKLRTDRRGVAQSACQVLVASNPELLAAGQGNLWDSGKVSSADNRLVYQGSPLQSRQACWWKVRIWDQGDSASAWSDAASWEMGLLKPSDWSAAWIGRTTDVAYQPAPLLRREFTVGRGLRRARIYVCGLGYCDLTVNGERPDERVLDPGYTRFDRRALSVCHDVTRLLREGNNALGVMLGTGWYNVHTAAAWGFHNAPWRAAPKLLLQLHLDYNDLSSEVVASDPAWRTATGPIIFDSIYGGEAYDARLEKPGWDRPGYDASAWQPALAGAPPGGLIVAQKSFPIMVW
jgi:alpha-L-rhamnosidase